MANTFPDAVDPSGGKTFLGHPRGLYVLFFAEMWERFSYYGMRALLILYLTKHLLFGDEKAYLIYGAYTALVYITPVIGGFLADRYLGHRKAVLFGGILIALGHLLLSVEGTGGRDPTVMSFFFAALAFIIVGTGFLKANISVIVGQLYPRDDARRDPAYTIFYIGINLGAFLGALVCGWLGETVGWSYGFGAAAVGMLAGIIVFVIFKPLLMGRGEASDPELLQQRFIGISREWLIYLGAILGVGVVWLLIQYQEVVGLLLGGFGAVVVAYILYTAVFQLPKVDRDRILAAIFLIALQPLFWGLFEQAGSSLNIYTDRDVDRSIFGYEVPASMFQSINSFYIITLAPFFAWLWTSLGKRGREPSAPAKFGLGLIQLGAGFLVLVAGAASSDGLTPVIFIFLIYLLHTTGELCLSPVGLSAMTRLAVPKMLGLMMGTWFLASAGGNYIAGLIARATSGGEGAAETASGTQVLDIYATIGWLSVAVGVTVFVVAPLVTRLMHLETIGEDADRDLAGRAELAEPAGAGIDLRGEKKPGPGPNTGERP
ncbi:peptide MFS transporter [Sphingosinicella rhizophila]|uniref:Peptide MFS transporter n=1 Tax=Sphingosinicella rhizophila TaxID=3050082 RepID=A0ABU3Q5D8_9SPHN|nr:peptide MFS transporter [Sphingosinicella sp. GR2756]MDT9598279.1 peptide MFS transporter [Sphingosinicella sp. GR2756]